MLICSTDQSRAVGYPVPEIHRERIQPLSTDSRHSNRNASTPVKWWWRQRIFPRVRIHLSAFRLWKTALRWS